MKHLKQAGIIAYGLTWAALLLIHLDMIFKVSFRGNITEEAEIIFASIHPISLPASLLILFSSLLGVWGILRIRLTSRNEVEKMVSPVTFTLFSGLSLPMVSSFLLLTHHTSMLLEQVYNALLLTVFGFYLMTGIFQVGMNMDTSRVRRFFILIPLASLWIASLLPSYIQESTIGLIGIRQDPTLLLMLAVLGLTTLITYWIISSVNKTRNTLLRAIKTTLVLIGAFLYIIGVNTPLAFLGSLLTITGTSLGLYRGRSSLL